MASRWGHDLVCEVCGQNYRTLRTGHSFASIVKMMTTSSQDSSDWKYKRRRGVLGFWHQLKLAEWKAHVDQCLYYFAQVA